MRFYSLKDEVITLNANLDSAKCRHFFFLKSDKGQGSDEEPKKKKRDKEANINLADLDARYEPDNLED